MALLDVKDTINGGEGTAFATVNGSIYDLFYAKKIEAKMEKNKDEISALGRRSVGSKSRGWKGTGTLTVYYMTSVYRNLMSTYNKTGKDFYFDIQITNQDANSETGKQTVILKNCNLDSITLTQLDIEASALEEELPFTFDDFEILDSFNQI